MVLGKLGEQIVLMSQKAFASIEFVNTIPAPNEIYLPKKLARDTAARKDFQQEKAGDTVSARGFGKFQLAAVGGVTKKGRTAIVVKRYI